MDKETVLKAADMCVRVHGHCKDCPLFETLDCADCFAEYILGQEKEPAPSANGTSSNDKNLHLDDTTLLRFCQEQLNEISKITFGDHQNEFITGYIVASKDLIERMKGERE